jgi:2'-5' RNA ligase
LKRLFAAIKTTPNPGYIDSYRSLQLALKQHSIKWTEEKNLHITLKFFGESSEGMIPNICCVIDSVASELTDFSFNYTGLGIFGSRYNPRVIWSGIQPYEEVSQIIQCLKNKLTTIGISDDRQNPVPHLTLGRIRSLQDRRLFQNALDLYKNLSSAPMMAKKIILFESILLRSGPEYHVIESFPFKK